MNQQVIVVHGGTTFDTYKDYISFLKNREISLDKLKSSGDWKNTLAEELGENFEVLLPRMPNGTNARYKEWKIWFERIIPFLKKDVILIGHSLGGIFLAKHLYENTFPVKIKATILVAAPFDDADSGESLSGFKLPSSLKKFSEQGGVIYLIQSKDDPVVGFGELGKYKKALPNARSIVLNSREHFNQESFPEIIELIRRL
ncbi:alpha/beta hydrolase [Candidatus Woesebacteria bacterium]|nr:alpha/beta hydrolase [Candidatus Woesebacteria bacterium]